MIYNNLHVLMIISSFYPMVGGAEKQALLLAQTLKEFGVKTTVLTRSYPGRPPKEKINGVEIVRVGLYKRNKIGTFISFIFWFLFGLKNLSRFDIFHAHQPFSSAFIAGIFSKITKKPAIVKIPSTKYSGTLGWRAKWLNSLVDAFIVTNKESQIMLSQSVSKPIIVIPNGVKIPNIINFESEKRRNKKIVLSVGRLEKRKGVDILIKAWPIVKKAIPEARLIIAGSGSLELELKKLVGDLKIQDSVKFIGEIDPGEIQNIYKKASCFVNPSFYEGISNSLLEAVSLKIPSVVSRIPGNVDIIKNAKMGWLFDPGDIHALAEGIINVFKNYESALNKAEIAYRHVIKEFDIRKTAQRYLSLYNSLLKKQT